MGLKDVLRAPARSVFKFFPPTQLTGAWTLVKPNFTNVIPCEPDEYDLATIYHQVVAARAQHGTLEEVPIKILRMLPWILFEYPKGQERKLGEDLVIVKEYFSWLKKRDDPRAQANLLHVLLRDYPVLAKTFDAWRTGVRMILGNSQQRRLQKTKQKVKEYGLLDSNGTYQLAERILNSEESPNVIMVNAGLEDALESGRFALEVYKEVLWKAEKALRYNERAQHHLSQVVRMSTFHDNTFKFPTARKELAEALLEPYAGGKAVPELKDDIRSFLIGLYRDPRIYKKNWIGVSDEARQVILGWLVKTTIEDFFEILDKTADDIWAYRKAFWGAYLERGAIDEAWVVLGSRAKRMASRFLKSESHGALTGSLSDQSVLLMKIGDLTIAEWSHSGKCRFWAEGRRENPNVPVLYGPSYSAVSLRAPATWEQIHHSSAKGGWQSSIRHYIKRKENINIPTNRLMP
nr:EH signature domain-containing protein [Pseudodesulfovibrio sp.]